jgi:hypothetical protein
MNTFSTWLTLVMLAIFTTMVGIATQYPQDAALMPYVVGIPGIGLCLLQLALDYKRAAGLSTYRFRSAPKAGKPEELATDEPEFGPQTVKREFLLWFYVLAFIGGILLFGFYVAMPVMLVTFLRREAGASTRFALLLGGGATLVLYLMFGALLQIRLHPGFLTPVILKAIGL